MVNRTTGRVFELLDMVAKARLKLAPQSQSPDTALSLPDKQSDCAPPQNPTVRKTNNNNNNSKTVPKEFATVPNITTPNFPKGTIGSNDRASLRTDSFAVTMKKASSAKHDTSEDRLRISTSELHEDDVDEEEGDEEDGNYESALDAECERLRVLLEEKFMMAESLRDS